VNSNALIHCNRCVHSPPELAAPLLFAILCFFPGGLRLVAAESGVSAEPVIEFIQNQVEVLRAGSRTWDAVSTNKSHNTLHPGDELRTGNNSRVGLRLPEHKATLILDSNSRFIVPSAPRSAFEILKGRLFNFHRGSTGEQRFKTPTVSAIVRGTDFSLKVENDGTTTLSMLAGEVRLENSSGHVDLKSGQEGIARNGEAPHRTAVITVAAAVQWCLYYPAVLDVAELPLANQERLALKDSLASYEAGDLLQAFASLPQPWKTGSRAEQLYGAALLLSVGNFEEARAVLASLKPAFDRTEQNERVDRLGVAIERMISIVKLERPPAFIPDQNNDMFATEYLVESYRLQAEGQLEAALAFARQATEKNPAFSYAWIRVAELEFGFRDMKAANSALGHALRSGSRDAEAAALKGFIFSAENRISDALEEFDRAIALDGKLANGWLGRGLCRFRNGQTALALDDLQMAATVEPQRAVLRGYLAKAWSEVSNSDRAREEIALAQQLDPNDPTAWLYSALLHLENHRANEAVDDLERSIALNDNRALFRSRLLLDEDRAVRGANLARVYERAGLEPIGLNEAARAVSYDQANYSAHLFLSDSFNLLRDPTRFNLRYETPWLGELLLANLLSPVGGTPLSQNISQQEYSRLFERNRVGLSSDTLVRSDGEIHELASQFGNVGNTAWALDLDYQHNDGVRRNNRLDRADWYTTLKQQLTPEDSVMLLFKYQDYESGDNFQYHDAKKSLDPDYHFVEKQHPIALAGYHREWAPGIHTLFLGGRLVNDQKLTDEDVPYLLLARRGSDVFVPGAPLYDLHYRNEFEAWTAELNQMFQTEKHTLIIGGRWQDGEFTGKNFLQPNAPDSIQVPFRNSVTEPADRATGYGYWHWRALDSLLFIGGVSYDHVTYPQLLRAAPVTKGNAEKDLLAPKAGVVWTPLDALTMRGAYTRSLGGVTLDQSFRLEPTQVAGFVQTYRTLFPISLTGPVSAQEFETVGAAMELKLPTRTYVTMQFERVSSDADHTRGVLTTDISSGSPTPIIGGGTRRKLEFEEHSAELTVGQLVGDEWSIGARYRFARADLRARLPDVPLTQFAGADVRDWSDLHAAGIFLLYNHRSGFFAQTDFTWYVQDNRERSFSAGRFSTRDLPSDDFPQWNLALGWRFPRQRGDVTFGVLNLTDENYHLSPVNFYNEMPHERVFYGRVRFRF
jgi:outer membrane receptor protein involved in Fe transport/predicted Zn-dependent protease